MQNRQTSSGPVPFVLTTILIAIGPICADEIAPPIKSYRPFLVVGPKGPGDGSDFGPGTPGTKTSGLQEAFDAAKAQAKDLYIAGGSWTARQTEPIVYFMSETLHIPWMQDFRLDGGHYVIQYTPKTGDAITIDSQMSCAYRIGLVASNSNGAVIRMAPTSAGPDGFKVITSSEFTINAVVGGGGAWPGGKDGDNKLDPNHDWLGVGLWLDGSAGSIDANKITVLETVGCQTGLLLRGAVTRNTIEEINIHLCREHLIVGDMSDPRASDNRIEAFVDSQGIEGSVGARLFGRNNMLTLSASRMAPHAGLILEESAEGNLVMAHQLPDGFTNRARSSSNRIVTTGETPILVTTPAVPAAGETALNTHPFPVEVRFRSSGTVKRWFEVDRDGKAEEYDGPITSGQSVILNPGEGIKLDYTEPPHWRWKGIR